jgi:hypothetical protein
MSKLSVARVNIHCAVTIADPSDTPAFSLSPSAVSPVRSALEFLGDKDALGKGSLELDEDPNPVSAPAPCSRCAALLC